MSRSGTGDAFTKILRRNLRMCRKMANLASRAGNTDLSKAERDVGDTIEKLLALYCEWKGYDPYKTTHKGS